MYARKPSSVHRSPAASGSRSQTIPKFKAPTMIPPRHPEAASLPRQPVASSSSHPSQSTNHWDYHNQESQYGTSQSQSTAREGFGAGRDGSSRSSKPFGMTTPHKVALMDDTCRDENSYLSWEPQRLEEVQSLGSTFEDSGQSGREKADQRLKKSGHEGFKPVMQPVMGQREIDEREAKNRVDRQAREKRKKAIDDKQKTDRAEAARQRATIVRPADMVVSRIQQEEEERKLERETKDLADSDDADSWRRRGAFGKKSHSASKQKEDAPEITDPSSDGSPDEVQVMKPSRPKARKLPKSTSPDKKKQKKVKKTPDSSPQKAVKGHLAKRRAEQQAASDVANGMEVDDEGVMSDDSILAKYRKDTNSDDELLRSDDEAIDPNTLCPFCSRPLPSTPSPRLAGLKAYLLDRPHIYPQATARNPKAMYLPAMETANFCRMHDREVIVIPEGVKRGWPQVIDWTALPKRIDRNHFEHLQGVIQGSVPCDFLKNANRDVEQQKGVRGILADMATFEVEQPGYYGGQGLAIMLTTLRKLFITDAPLLDPFRCAPLSVESYLRKVLIPELALGLIREDLGPYTTREAAKTILQESRPYGNAMFGGEDDAEHEPLTKEEEENEAQDEKENLERGNSEGKSKDKGKSKENGKGKGKEEKKKKSSQQTVKSMFSRRQAEPIENLPSSGNGMRKPKRKLQIEQQRLGHHKPSSAASTSAPTSEPNLDPDSSPDAKNKLGGGWFGKTTQPLAIPSSAEGGSDEEESEAEISKPPKKRKSVKPIVIDDSESD